ncbi:MAG: hypothetical protein KAS86_02565 [Candidatus Omnitrophica bacterium]|nr:hypothetical protein [Candidatus Omnitrophota bacterium]
MDIAMKQLEKNTWKEFSRTIFLMGVIPFLALFVILAEKVLPVSGFMGNVNYVLVMTLIILIQGVIVGGQLIRKLIKELIAFNEKNDQIRDELMEKSKLAAISQTVLTLSHEINNPLMVVTGNIELLARDATEEQRAAGSERFKVITNNCGKIKNVLSKMAALSKPVLTTVAMSGTSKLEMIDLDKSESGNKDDSSG